MSEVRPEAEDWFYEACVDLEEASDALQKGRNNWACFAAQQAVEDAMNKAQEYGIKEVGIKVQGPGSGRETAVKSQNGVLQPFKRSPHVFTQFLKFTTHSLKSLFHFSEPSIYFLKFPVYGFKPPAQLKTFR